LMAEKVLQFSSKSYSKARYTEKANQVLRLLGKVREEKKLAISLSEVLHAPAITSSTASFATMSLSEEKAVGLERFAHADVQAKLVQNGRDIKIGQDVSLEIQIVNAGKDPVLLTKIEGIVPPGFQLVGKPDYCSFENSSLIFSGKRLAPLDTVETKIVLRSSFVAGCFQIKPKITCVDETGRQMYHNPEPLSICVSKIALPGRVTTGYPELDDLLLGGIPENYAVLLTSPSSDERAQLVQKFLEAGAERGQITFHITADVGSVNALGENLQSNFYLFVCNSRANLMIKNLPNVFKLSGVENLTDIDISLAKAFRTLDVTRLGTRRACVEIVSDVMLQHHAVITRKWLSGLLPELRSRGFTTLAVLNPQMHTQEEVQAIKGLFEGEIQICERETDTGFGQFLRVRKLFNQHYLENELMLKKE
jgi:KaiC/GvpD/RAD55 family RecA-like ATPase